MLSVDTPRRLLTALVLSAPALLLLLVFFAGPFLFLLRLGFWPAAGRGFYQAGTWTTENYIALFADPYHRQVLVFTLLLGCGVTGLVLLLALPLSVFVHALPPARRDWPSRPSCCRNWRACWSSCTVCTRCSAVPASSTTRCRRSVSSRSRCDCRAICSAQSSAETYLLLPYAVLVLVVSLGRIDQALFPAGADWVRRPGRHFAASRCP